MNGRRDPLRDPDRLRALRETGLLGAPAEARFDQIARLAAEVLEAPVALINLVTADAIFCASGIGLPEPWASRRSFPHSHSFCPRVVETGETLLIEDARRDPRARSLPVVTELGVIAYAGAPLRTADGHVIGTLCVVDRVPWAWSERDRRILETLAALVMTEVRLDAEIRRGDYLKGQEEAREVAEAGRRRASLLAEASRILASTLDYRATLRSVADIIVPSLADVCIIDIRENGEFRRFASGHADPELDRIARALEEFPPGPDADHLVAKVMEERTGRIVPLESDAERRAIATGPGSLELIREMDPHTEMVVPLVARGRALGVVHLIATDPERRYGPGDLEFARDLLDRAALSVENARLYEQAVIANRARTNFLAVMSHELRTPLTAVLGYADLLAEEIDGELNDRQKQRISRIRASAEHLLELIDEILAFTRMESGTVALELTEVDLVDVAREAAEAIRPAAEAKGLAFREELPRVPVRSMTDPAKLRRILQNLLTNAVRFTNRGYITLRLEVEGDHAAFRVTDTGAGISREQQGKMFEPFWQAAEPTTRTTGGTGLGLPVALNLVRMLDGEIDVSSTPGEGSTFTVRIPLQPPEGAHAAA